MSFTKYDGNSYRTMRTAKRHDGSSWVPLTICKRWNNSSWVNILERLMYDNYDPIYTYPYSTVIYAPGGSGYSVTEDESNIIVYSGAGSDKFVSATFDLGVPMNAYNRVDITYQGVISGGIPHIYFMAGTNVLSMDTTSLTRTLTLDISGQTSQYFSVKCSGDTVTEGDSCSGYTYYYYYAQCYISKIKFYNV